MASIIKRGGVYYLQWRAGRALRRRSLHTPSLQLAKERLRQFESAQAAGQTDTLPTRPPLPQIVAAYVEHVRATKTAKSAQTDTYYLRELFGPICPGLEITSRRPSPAARKRPPKPGQDRRCRPAVIEAAHLEEITTTDIVTFVNAHTLSRGLAPKTANRYREIIVRLFNWAMKQRGVRMPGRLNPAAAVERRRDPAPEIRFLTLAQVDEQLDALADEPELQAMVATLIYAGLRREELLWLRREDVSLPPAGRGLISVRAKTVAGERWQPKTKRNRAVPISPALRRQLDRYAPRPNTGDWYFPSPLGRRWDPDNFSAALRAANQAAGLQWGCLDYRHTFGSQLAQKGVSLYKISQLMGNSPEICRRHYAALVPEALGEDVEFSDQGIPAMHVRPAAVV